LLLSEKVTVEQPAFETHAEAVEQPASERIVWPVFAVVTVTVIALAAIRWSLDHPYGIHWDEAQYFNDVGIDVQRLRGLMLVRLAGRILIKIWGRPPAYRLLALPFLALFGFHTATARLVSLACFGLSSWFIYLATRRLGSRVAGAFAVLIFALSPEVISASIFFSTDTPLYLAVSAMLYYLFASWTDTAEHPSHWIGLGLAIGLGFLSKASFAAIAFPVLAFAFLAGRWGYLGVPRLASPLKAGALAFLVAAPWWLVNIRAAVITAHIARTFVRNSLGPPSLATWIRWLNSVFQCLLGHGVSILIGLVLIACVIRVIKKEAFVDPLRKAALGACACAGAPIILAQLSGTNHLLRHISPAVIPLAIAVGVLSDTAQWARSWASITLSGTLFFVQLAMIVAPVLFPNNHPVDLGFVNGALPWRTMVRFDQWNWTPVRDISQSCGVDSPTISYLGAGRAFDPPQIEYPWVAQIIPTRRATFPVPDVRWLWRYEDGPLDWQKVMGLAGQSDIVLTAPHQVGEVRYKEDLDNQYNAEFAERLSRDPRFRGPIRLEMGRFEPVEVDVFLKKAGVCQSAEQTSAKR
jgi:4-amino-4-deoxy-L-arabinose transferase-like glycosyltransferase